MAEDSDGIEASKAPLLDHLIELRQRLIYAFGALAVAIVVGYLVAQPVYDFLMAPLEASYSDWREARIADMTAADPQVTQDALDREAPEFRAVYINVFEPFVTKLKLSVAIGFAIAFPLIAAQIWKFVAPGLYRSERRAFLPFLVATPVLFILGATLLYYIVMPLAFNFMITIGADFGAKLDQRIGEYLTVVIRMILAFGISFQLPVLLMLLARAGIVTAAGLARARKYAIVGIFAFAAFITPPDIVSQIILGIPMLVLYELSVLGARLAEKQRARAAVAE